MKHTVGSEPEPGPASHTVGIRTRTWSCLSYCGDQNQGLVLPLILQGSEPGPGPACLLQQSIPTTALYVGLLPSSISLWTKINQDLGGRGGSGVILWAELLSSLLFCVRRKRSELQQKTEERLDFRTEEGEIWWERGHEDVGGSVSLSFFFLSGGGGGSVEVQVQVLICECVCW